MVEDGLPLEDKISFTYSLFESIKLSEQKPNFELWEKAVKSLQKDKMTLDEVTDEISILTLIDPKFKELPHMSYYAFLRKINPNRPIIVISSNEKEKIKRSFMAKLKKHL